jgi:ATP-dependent Clp protease adapter protein ClpS
MGGRRGYFKVAEIRGAPILVHWSLPAGGVLVSLLGQVDPRQWIWYCVAFAALIAVHEAGHVLAVVGLRLKVFAVEISGLGGLCKFEPPQAIRQSVLIYAAGLLAQIALLLPTLAYVVSRNGFPAHAFGRAICITFTIVNVALLLANMIPARDQRTGLDTDGALLWRLYLHVFRGQPHPHPPLAVAPLDQAPVFPPETRLLTLSRFRQPGFVQGIEVLNDRTTPMEFVVQMFVQHLSLTEAQAIAVMLDIHNKGGVLIPLPTASEARRIADAISAEAQAAGHALTCRFAGQVLPD